MSLLTLESTRTQESTVRRYTQAERDVGVALAEEKGIKSAARELDVPYTTLHAWVRKARAPQPKVVAEPEAKAPPKKRGARRYTPSEKALILEDAAELGVSAAARKHGVTRFSIYGWRHKLRLAAQGEGESPTTGPDPAGDRHDKQPSRCQRGNPRVRVACQPGALDVTDRVEEL